MPDPLDIAKFNLEALRTQAQIRVDLMKAYADFNFRMAEVVEKQVKIAKDREELRQLKFAHREYRTALSEVKRELRKADREEERLVKKTRDAERLSWGEWLDPDLVSKAWTGFRYLVNQLHGPERAALFSTKIAAKHRRGEHFSRNRSPNSQCEDAPGSIRNAISLFEWAKKKSYMPRVGSPPYEVLSKLLTALQANAEKELTALAEQLASARKELMELRMANWRKVGIAEHPPKKAK